MNTSSIIREVTPHAATTLNNRTVGGEGAGS